MPVYKNNGIHARLVREERQIPEFFAFAWTLAGRLQAPGRCLLRRQRRVLVPSPLARNVECEPR
jgi:hypothetical protein